MAEATAIIGAITGCSGLVLSIYNAVIQRREKLPDIRVFLQIVFYLDDHNQPTGYMLHVSVQNHGSVTVTLKAMELRLEDESGIIPKEPNPMGQELPREITSGNAFTYCCSAKELAGFFRQNKRFHTHTSLVAAVTDELGRTYESKPFRFDLTQSYE